MIYRSDIKQKKAPTEKQKIQHENTQNRLTFWTYSTKNFNFRNWSVNHMESSFQWSPSETGARSACDHCNQLLHHLRVHFASPYMTYTKIAQKMATGRETRSNPVPKFAVGEKVLCYEPDPNKARVLYESKVNFVERIIFMLVSVLTKIFWLSHGCMVWHDTVPGGFPSRRH